MHPKSLPNLYQKRSQIPIASRTRFFRFFIDLLTAPGLPKSSQNLKKSQKKTEKWKLKKNTFSNTIFSRFFVVLAYENPSRIETFSHFFRKRRFCKNRAPAKAPCIFSRFGAFKKRPKIDAKTHSKKASQKNVPEIDFGLRFGLPKPFKIDPTSKKALLKTKRKKAAMQIKLQRSQPNGHQAF